MAASADTIAARIVAALHPSSAQTRGCDDLRHALARRGVSGGGRALLIWRDAAFDRDVDAAVVLASVPHDTDSLEWLGAAMRAGFTPDVAFDASFFSARAVLLHAAAPASQAVLQAAAALIEARAALALRAAELDAATQAFDDRVERLERAQHSFTGLNIGLQDELQITRARLAVAEHERALIVQSTSWRATAPVRRLLNRLPRRSRTALGLAAPAESGLSPSAYQRWIAQHDTLTAADRAAIAAHIAQLADRPTLSVIMPVYDAPQDVLRAAIGSVQAQLYPHWQLCIADDASPAPHVARVVEECAAQDARIRWVRCPQNGNIAAATNAALALADGAFVALMDHDDLLTPHALYRVAVELAAHPDADLIYSDEDQLDTEGRRTLPYFKPDWNIDLMRAHNMVSHLGVYRRALVARLGGMRLGYEGSQDYDLALRVADATTPDRIRHIPAVLYHWRQHTTSFSKARIDLCVAAARRAIGDHLARTGVSGQATVRPSPAIPTWTRVQWALPDPAPRVSAIVPTRDKPDLLRRCAEGLLQRTDYADLELIIVDNGSVQADTIQVLEHLAQDTRVRVLAYPGAFNFSAMNNAAAAIATGSVLALINNDIEVIQPDWLTEMVSQALRPEIGAVGARLLYPDGTVQHAGVVLGVGSFDGGPGVAGHFSLADSGSSFGYFGLSVLVHEVAAVTAACMVVRRAAWNDVGGMDAVNLPVAFNDVDLCLRLRARGLHNLWTPHAELIHHESASRGDDLAPEHRDRFAAECRTMRDRWARVLDADPFYNPNFSRTDGMFRLLGASTRRKVWA